MLTTQVLDNVCELFSKSTDGFVNLNLADYHSAIVGARREAAKVRGLTYRSLERVKVKPDLSVAAGADQGEVYGSGGVVPYCRLKPRSPLRSNYRSILSHVGEGLGKKLYPYDMPYGSVNVIFMKEGEEQPWHFDFCAYTLILIASVPKSGGVLEAKSPSGALFKAKSTGIVLLNGEQVLHRVTPVEDRGERISITWGLSRRIGQRSTAQIRRLRYGVG